MNLGLADNGVENTWAQCKGREEPRSLEATWSLTAELHSKGGSVQGFQCCSWDLASGTVLEQLACTS